MSLYSAKPSKSTAEEEIDLRELCAVLLRHRLLLLAFTVLGLALAGLVAIAQKPTRKICLIVNISEGPIVTRKDIDDRSEIGDGHSLARSVYSSKPLQANLDEVMYSLRRSLYAIGPQRLAREMTISPLKLDNILSGTQVALCGSAQFDSEIQQMRNLLDSVADVYKRGLFERYTRLDMVEPPSPFWTQVNQEPSENLGIRRFFVLGAIGGLMAGSIAALIADLRLNRVFRLDQLLGILSYPLVSKLPAWPWDHPAAQAEIAQLVMQLDPALSWLVFSIGREHPMTRHLVDALHCIASGVDLQHMPPLLTASIIPPCNLRAVGVLVVVERGFNSRAALLESRRVLESLSFVREVGVVLVGAPLPPELSL